MRNESIALIDGPVGYRVDRLRWRGRRHRPARHRGRRRQPPPQPRRPPTGSGPSPGGKTYMPWFPRTSATPTSIPPTKARRKPPKNWA